MPLANYHLKILIFIFSWLIKWKHLLVLICMSVLNDQAVSWNIASPYSGDFSCLNLGFTNLDINSYSCLVKTKAKPLTQQNTYLGFHSEVKTLLKYTGWFNSAVFFPAVKCLSTTRVSFSLAFLKLKVNKALCKLPLEHFTTPLC